VGQRLIVFFVLGFRAADAVRAGIGVRHQAR
jgi:hypothetical protein